jgi:hypothetical protein
MVGGAAASGADDAEGMSVVEEEAGPVLLQQGEHLRQPQDLPLGTEHPVGDDQGTLVRGQVVEAALQALGVVVLVANHAGARRLPQPHAVVDAGVVVPINDRDGLLVGQQRRQRRQVHLVTGGEDQGRFLVQEGSKLLL